MGFLLKLFKAFSRTMRSVSDYFIDITSSAHRHQVNGCFLPERGGVEGTPSTNRNFEPSPCFLLA
jgi:hypothetical protein